MKITIKILVALLLSILILHSCDNSSGGAYYDEFEEFYDEDEGFADGTYCAEVDYYNPNTGTRSTYTLNVEVESNEVTVIYWTNGGWLDDDHFYPEELDEDGYCSFESDRGYEYEIQITGSECSFTDAQKAENEYRRDLAAITCSRCGDEKDEYDDYCYSCESEIEDEEENTCSRCGGFEYYVYGGLCSSCEEEENDDW